MITAGVDEAGRGPLAGPVVCAAVILPPDDGLAGLDDSKKLGEGRREQLFEAILGIATAHCIQFIDPATIDRMNILQATLHGMRGGEGTKEGRIDQPTGQPAPKGPGLKSP